MDIFAVGRKIITCQLWHFNTAKLKVVVISAHLCRVNVELSFTTHLEKAFFYDTQPFFVLITFEFMCIIFSLLD